MIILNDTLGAVGGSHTLFLRMCDWYRKQGVEVSFFCNNRDNEEIASHLEEIGVSIHVIDTTDIKATYRLLKMIDDGKLQIINFWSNRYLDIEAIKWKYKIEIDYKQSKHIKTTKFSETRRGLWVSKDVVDLILNYYI